MGYTFPIDKVEIKLSNKNRIVESPLFAFDFIRVAPDEISIDIEGVASFYIKDGKKISITPYPDASDEMIQSQLEKWGIISILHQRRILNFHASSFSLDGSGIMICGDTGAGKSSVTAAFNMGEGIFMNDDITAITFIEEQANIIKHENSISLTSDSLQQLQADREIDDLQNGMKLQIQMPDKVEKHTPLQHIFHLQVDSIDKPVFKEVSGAEKFSLLRSNICSWEMLKGIPGSEAEYMSQLLKICDKTPITTIIRAKNTTINAMANAIMNYLNPE